MPGNQLHIPKEIQVLKEDSAKCYWNAIEIPMLQMLHTTEVVFLLPFPYQMFPASIICDQLQKQKFP